MIAWYYVLIAWGFGVGIGLLVGGLARSASASDAALARMLDHDTTVVGPKGIAG